MGSSISFVTVSDDRFGRKDGKYSETQDMAFNLIKDLGFSNLFFWKWQDILKTDFYNDNKKLLDNPDPALNGRAYKPFVICESLKSIKDGDFLIYNDVSPEHWRNFSFSGDFYDMNVVKDLCSSNGGILSREPIWICGNEVAPHSHENFTLERCISRMGMQKYRHSIQHASGLIVIQKSKKTLEFAEEWLKWNLIDECASLESMEGESYWGEEVERFGKIGHRHDQSISGLLINDMNFKILKALDEFNFRCFCKKNFNYEFIETNTPPSEYVYRNTLVGEEWKYLRFLRSEDPKNVVF